MLEPDAFLNDWYGYLTNQTGHLMLGVLLFSIVSFVFSLLFTNISRLSGEGAHEWAMSAILVGYGLWEAMQGGLAWDGVEDLAFVMGGASFSWAAWVNHRAVMVAVVSISAAALSVGVSWRKK